jgi:phosphoglycolate phosphatase-like HAD superfamily hydrolase
MSGDGFLCGTISPDIYLYVLEQLGIAARNCVAVEDAAIGLRAARAAGIVTLVAVSDYTRDEDFTGAAAILSDLGDPTAPAQTLAGFPPPRGFVDVPYLRELLASAESS